MALTDVLNPIDESQQGIDPALGCSANPSYGFTRKRTQTAAQLKAAGISPYMRQKDAVGHVFVLSFLDRTEPFVKRLRKFGEQFEFGFFVINDWDDPQHPRPYVGRFTSPVDPVRTKFGLSSVQGLQFEEVLLPYMPPNPAGQLVFPASPNDWDDDAVEWSVTDDWGTVKVASYLAAGGAWTPTQHQLDDNDAPLTTLDAVCAANDWAQYEYLGYGFKLYALGGPDCGIANVLLDGVAVASNVDLYSAAPTIVEVTVQESVPVGIHRVKLQATGAKNAASTALNLRWLKVKVMK